MTAAEKPAILLYSIAMTAEATSLSKSTIRRAIQSGQLKATRVGDRVMVRPESIVEWIEAAS